ncbi:FAD-dependent oxidoreductase [Kribbella sp. NPDC055071]
MNKVLIVGAGLTGLSLASGLRLRGTEPVVVEQAPVITEAGWAIGLSSRHLGALDELGIDWRVWPGQQTKNVLIFDGRTGVLDHIREGRSVVFSRTELQLSLLEPVADLVRTGVRPTELTDHGDRVEVRFDDGRAESFDAVIGADGINSWTRQHALEGSTTGFTGCAVVRFHAPNVDNLDVNCIAVGDDATLGYLLLDGGKKFHGIVFLSGDAGNRRELSLPQLADLFPHVTGPLAGVRDAMRTEPDSYYTNINQALVPRWSRNRVAVMGDAAHAMSPILGQGAGAGLQDAALLADLLTLPHMPVPHALASYEHIRKPQAQKVQRASLATSHALRTAAKPSDIFPDFTTL